MASILEGLTQHMEHARLVKHACMALAAMVEPDGELYNGQKSLLGEWLEQVSQ